MMAALLGGAQSTGTAREIPMPEIPSPRMERPYKGGKYYRPKDKKKRTFAGRKVCNVQPKGYYSQEIPEIHMHSHARGMNALKETLNRRHK